VHRTVIKHVISSVLNISKQSSGLSLNNKKYVRLEQRRLLTVRQIHWTNSYSKPNYNNRIWGLEDDLYQT